jgi:UDP-glucose 4-epimerase
MRVLVTGGAGYVGSVSAELLLERGHEVTVYDSLATGHRAAVPAGAEFVQASLGDRAEIDRTLRGRRIEAVLHCAARALVGESVADPGLYYRENVAGGVALLDALRDAVVDRLVFSSSAAVYGAPTSTPIEETAELRPVNPYGESKRAFEGALHWYGEAHGLRSFALRYFNAAGASAALGEDHTPETHLIPNMLAGATGGPPLTIHGTDYPTPDGTCVRDYIHVRDLAEAHLSALEATAAAPAGLEVCNLGSGSGFSVRHVLHTAEQVLGQRLAHDYGPRRPGDPPVLVASIERAREILGWQPTASLEEIIASAWRWRQGHPRGYEDG